MDDLAVARDERYRTRNLIGVDVVLDEPSDSLKPLRRNADCLGFRKGQIRLRNRAPRCYKTER